MAKDTTRKAATKAKTNDDDVAGEQEPKGAEQAGADAAAADDSEKVDGEEPQAEQPEPQEPARGCNVRHCPEAAEYRGLCGWHWVSKRSQAD